MDAPIPAPDPHTRTRLQESLLDWAAANLRALPWRTSPRHPYRVWISEAMLQQTRVDTVTAYFKRWMERFPDIETLAATPLDDVLKAWEGMGYYARARNLHAAARQIVRLHGGVVPSTRRELQALPGVGRYTAGAILSLAFGQDEPVVDGNVRRVLCRLFAIGETDARRLDAALWSIATMLLPHGKAGPFNEALMELGATVCTPRAPLCAECPWASDCRAHAAGREQDYPPRRARPSVPHYDVAAAVISGGKGRFLVAQRAAQGLLGGLWEFPGGKVQRGETLQECLRREILEELGVEIEVGALLTAVRHAYTHFRITLHAFDARILGGEPRCLECAAWRWIRLEEADGLAFSAADLKVLAALEERQAQGQRSAQSSLSGDQSRA